MGQPRRDDHRRDNERRDNHRRDSARRDSYRRAEALRWAAAKAAVGEVNDLPRKLHDAGFGGLFSGLEALAREAQAQWWHRLLGRLDGDFPDDLGAVSAADRWEAAREAWTSQATDMAGYLTLARSCPASAEVTADLRRFSALLAMYVGEAPANGDLDAAGAAGADLVSRLTAPPAVQRRWSGHRWLHQRRPRRTPAGDRKLELLRSSPLLGGCQQGDLVALGRAADLIEAEPGQVLVDNARPGEWWWWVLSGEVEMVIDGRTARVLRGGDSLGPEPRRVFALGSASLIAQTSAQLLVAHSREIIPLLETNSRLAAATQPASVGVGDEAPGLRAAEPTTARRPAPATGERPGIRKAG